jgi:hypothetical protein
MTSRLSLFFASTSLTLAMGLPALAAGLTPVRTDGQCGGVCAAVFTSDDLPLPLIRVSGDDDEEDDEDGGWFRRGHDDDDDEDECEDDDDEDDACMGAGGRGNPAPAGTVAPPANGLFGSGAPPAAVTK